MLKRRISTVLVAVFVFAFFSNTFAASSRNLDLKLPEGENTYVFHQAEVLSATEIERIRAELASEYRGKSSPPRAAGPRRQAMDAQVQSVLSPRGIMAEIMAETERFRIYPITVIENGNYVFKGIFVGGNIENEDSFISLEYQLESDSASPTTASLTTASPSTINALGRYVYPDSRIFGYDQYASSTDNWQSTSMTSSLEKSVLYYFELTFTENETATPTTATPTTASPTDATPTTATPTTASPIVTSVKSEPFAIYEFRAGDTFAKVARAFQIPLSILLKDNKTTGRLPKPGATIFIRNPKNKKMFMRPDTILGKDEAYYLGASELTEFAYSLVNLSTGNVYYSSEDVTLDEYGGFAIHRGYNSLAKGIPSLFGEGFSSNLDMQLICLDDDTMLFIMADGKEIKLRREPDGSFLSWDKVYALEIGSNDYTITDQQLNVWKFNEYGQLTEINDKQKLPIVLEYDNEQSLKAIISQSGKRFNIELNNSGQISRIIKPDGTTLQYEYDSDKLTSFIDECGFITTYTYDPKDRLSAEINALGKPVFAVTYDDKDRAVTYKDGKGALSAFAYDDGVVRFTDGRNITTEYRSDSRNRLVEVLYADGTRESNAYDLFDRLASHTDRAGDTLSYRYDARGNITNALINGEVILGHTYDANNNRLSTTDYQRGVTTYYEYDAHSNNTKIIFPDGSEQVIEYDGRNRPVRMTSTSATIEFAYTGNEANASKITDGNGNESTYTYNAMGQLTSTTAAGGTSTNTYTANGLIESATDALGNTKTYEYDAAGNNTAVIEGEGEKTSFVYDDNGRVEQIIDAENHATTYTYDPTGNILSEQNAKGETKSYEYDTVGNISKTTDAEGVATSLKYDAKNRVIEERDADGATITYEYHPKFDVVTKKKDKLDRVELKEYDDAGNLIKTTLPDGTELTSTYDKMNRMLTTTDEKGIVTTYAYDASGNIIEARDSQGIGYTFEYDANNNLIKKTNTLGYSATYTYDSLNRLLTETDALGKAMTYVYDDVGQRIQVTDRDGNSLYNTFDASGNIVSVKDGNGNVVKKEYDGNKHVTKETFADGSVFAYVYDQAGLLVKTVDPYGKITVREYNSKGKPIKLVNELGCEENNTYDSDGNLIKTVFADGSEQTNTYNKIGWKLSTTYPSGLTINYEYDIMGRVIRAADSEGREVRYTYDSVGNLIEEIDTLGNKISFAYNAYSKLIEEKDYTGAITRYEYDSMGRACAITDEQGRKTAFEYNAVDSVIKVIRFDGSEQVMTNDGSLRVTSLTNELGNTVRYEYDGNGNIKTVTDPLGNTTQRKYDHNNNIVSETDKRGNTYTYQYDALSRLISTSSPEGAATTLEYDAAGNLTATKDALGYITSFEYDKLGNCLSITDARNVKTEMTYNPLRQVDTLKRPDGSELKYQYDAYGNNTEILYPNGTKEIFAYDAMNRLTKETGVSGVTTSYAYDIRGNLTGLSDSTGRRVSYEYDNFNRKTKEVNVLGGSVSYSYDRFDRVTGVRNDLGGEIAYAYDPVGQMIRKTDARGKVTRYSYDANGNVLRIDDGGRQFGFTYDANGNLLKQTLPNGSSMSRTYDKDNRLIAESDLKGQFTAYAYDLLSQVTSVTDRMGHSALLEYDALGNVSKQVTACGEETLYAYNVMNQLAQVTEPENRVGQYEYDGMGNLSRSLVTSSARLPGDARQERMVYYTHTDTNKINSVGSVKPTDEGAREQFGYSDTGYREQSVLASGKVIAYERDKMGNVTDISYGETDPLMQLFGSAKSFKTDEPAVTKEYDAWGRLTEMTDKLGKSQYKYDEAGALTEIKYSEGVKFGYGYNQFGEIVSVSYPGKGKVLYERNDMGWVTSVTGFDGKAAKYSYDANGNILGITRPDGTKTESGYDALDRLTATRTLDKDGKLISGYTYSYDAMGRIVAEEITDAGGKTAKTYAYNKRGELVKYIAASSGGTESVEYTFDVFGNREKEARTGMDGRKTTLSFEYDAQDRLLAERENGLPAAAYTYDSDGNLIKKAGGGKTTTYEYDEENRLEATLVNGTLVSSITYDGNGLKGFELLRKEYPANWNSSWAEAQIKTTIEEKETWEKEEHARRLKAGKSPSGDIEPFAEVMDAPAAAGGAAVIEENMEALPGSGAYTERLIEKSSMSQAELNDAMLMTHLPAGALSAYAPPLANVLLDFARRLWEDILKAAVEIGSLISGKAPDSGQNAGGSEQIPDAEETADEQVPYSYPIPQGFADKTVMVPELRAKYLTEEKYEKILNHFFDRGNGIGAYYEPTRYFFDLTRENPAVLAEYGNNDAMRTGYAYGADSRLLSMAQDDSIGFYIHDGRGSVSELIQSAQIESYRYEPYGVMIQGAPKQDRVFGFNGEEYTPQTGLQYLRARHYNPFDGRFTTQDTYLGNLTQTITQNRYAYCNNDPVTNIDPSGFASKKNSAGSSSAPKSDTSSSSTSKSSTGSSGSSGNSNAPSSITPQAGYHPNATTTLMQNGVPVGTYNLSTGQLVSPIVLGSGYHPNQTATMYKDGVPAYTVYLASGIRVPILPANYYNYSQNPKVSASSGGVAALQQYFNKLAVQQNMLYFSGTTTNAERALWDSLWKDTVPNMSFSQVVDVWQGMTLLNAGAGYSAKDAMTTTAFVNSYAGVNTGTVMQEVARMLAPGFSIINGELVENHVAYYNVANTGVLTQPTVLTFDEYLGYIAEGFIIAGGTVVMLGGEILTLPFILSGDTPQTDANTAPKPTENSKGKRPPSGKEITDPLIIAEIIRKITEQAERAGSALKDDAFHRAGSFLSEAQLSVSRVFHLIGGDGASRILVQTPGSVNGVTGVFEYIINSSGVITHQLFKAGGIINGIPN